MDALPRGAHPVASHFVAGGYCEDAGGVPMPAVYPGTGEAVATVHAATDAIVNSALDAARSAQPAWAALTGTARGRILRRAADIIRSRNHELSVLETIDTGKPLQETLVADATSAADALEYFGGLAAALTGESVVLGDDFSYTIRDPLGVCVGLGAWNFPTQIACWKAAPALACGNAMVFKPSEVTPLCALKVAEILTEAGLPDGVFNVVQGAGEVGAALAADPRVAKVSLTGSVPTGTRVYTAAAAGMKHVTMELGGKSPILVFDDADIETAVGGAILGNFYASGQICSNGTRVFVQRGIKDAFVERLLERLSAAQIGDPLDPSTNFGPLVSENHLRRVLGYIEAGRNDGARLLCGGERIDRPGFFLAPAVFDDVRDDAVIAREEIFGPVLSLFAFDDEAEAVTRANATPFGLSAGVFTRDIARAHRVARALEAGTCWINTYNVTPVEVPFGGTKASGLGRENARAAIEHYSVPKTVYVGLGPLAAPY